MTSLFSVKNIQVVINGRKIIKNLNLEVGAGEIVAIMGPNGSGKSTLAMALTGHPLYQTKSSTIRLNDEEISALPAEERARKGLFLAFQQPVAVPGVSLSGFLRLSKNTILNYRSQNSRSLSKTGCPTGTWLKQNHNSHNPVNITQFLTELKKDARLLNLPEDFLKRHLNDGLSGGEKKKTEALQALILKPRLAIFDEIDTGLDIDALKTVALAITRLSREKTGIIVITHYHRLLKYLKPDRICILINGQIVKEGKENLARILEKRGYGPFLN
ncbi:MAG: Fe-S cluster assembly ATPase SufC [Patescibacteria group bacterium]|nr:Fe-S cluster assembly ATPase SufC [Patescibacteria group bacterium]